jgi:hypothetical protein
MLFRERGLFDRAGNHSYFKKLESIDESGIASGCQYSVLCRFHVQTVE